ncbi:MAG: sigma-70 family RNA polymerase sigma factor [Victivallales bacterium]|nr:sigma-70 family RNA polymerase sigma factor [Victivallales bacterium]
MMSETADNENAVRPVTAEDVYDNKGAIINVGRRLGFDYDSCEDLVQEVAFRCWDRRVQFDPSRGTLAAYVSRIAHNIAVDKIRRNKLVQFPCEDTVLEVLADGRDEYEDGTDWEERRMRLEKLLQRGIDEMYRRYPSRDANDAFVMFSVKGMRAREVMRELGVEERFVNVAVHRGMERLTAIVRRLEQDGNEAC